MLMEDLWLRQTVHGWVLFLGIESVYSDKSERNYRGKCLGWPVTSYGGGLSKCSEEVIFLSFTFYDFSLRFAMQDCFFQAGQQII